MGLTEAEAGKAVNYISPDAYEENGFIIIELKPRSRVVSFKLKEDVLRRFDRLLVQYNLGNRSEILRGIVNGLLKVLENLGDSAITELIVGVKYMDMEEGCEKITTASIKL